MAAVTMWLGARAAEPVSGAPDGELILPNSSASVRRRKGSDELDDGVHPSNPNAT